MILRNIKQIFKTWNRYGSSINYERVKQDFEKDGFALLKNFYPLDQCEKVKDQMKDLVSNYRRGGDESTSIFSTDGQERVSDEYFLKSGDFIHFFLEGRN